MSKNINSFGVRVKKIDFAPQHFSRLPRVLEVREWIDRGCKLMYHRGLSVWRAAWCARRRSAGQVQQGLRKCRR
jgi:hypothetical protein